MASGNTLIVTLKMVLMSTGVVFIAILLSLSLPELFTSAASDLPTLWSTFRSWLRPPYLYVIINGIIITIAASSRLHHRRHETKTAPSITPPADQFVSYGAVSVTEAVNGVGSYYGAVSVTDSDVEVVKSAAPPVRFEERESNYRLHHHHHRHETTPSKTPPSITAPADQFDSYGVVSVTEVVNGVGSYYGAVSVRDSDVEVRFEVRESKIVEEVKAPVAVKKIAATIGNEREKWTVVEKSTWTTPSTPPKRQESLEFSPDFLSERPPASSRFGHHRRPAKASPAEGGKALRVAKPKKHETLETTWKALTEGRHMPLTRHLKKSDTWENHGRQINLLDSSPLPTVKKSETFKDRTNRTPPPVNLSSSKLKKEPSLSQDDLNRRVEAFINKFNEDMRLQRQQSIQQFMEMINRAA